MNRTTDFIPFFKPSIGCEEENAVISVLRSGWLTTGKITERFEREFAEYMGCQHALAVSSATAGLHLSLESLGVRENMSVITTPYTFAATAEVIRYLDADPLFVDIEAGTFNIDCDLVERQLKSDDKVAAIIPVHFAGLPCEMGRLMELSSLFNTPVVEDAAHCFPVRAGKKYIGTIGDVGVFSFYVTKPITTGEGGMIVTDRGDIVRRIKVMRLHGIDRDVWQRYTSPQACWEYNIVEAGYKYNLTDIASSIGIVQLQKAKSFLAKRQKIAQAYINAFSKYDFLKLPKSKKNHAWHLFVVRVVKEKLSLSRNQFMQELRRRGIGTSVHFTPLHMMPYYKNRYGHHANDFPISLECYLSSMSLPIYPDMTDGELRRVIDAVISIGVRSYRTQF